MAMRGKTRETNVCGITWVRRIAGVNRGDKQRIEELREEAGEELVLCQALAYSNT